MNNMSKKLNSHNDVLRAIADTIDIPEHLDELARKRYASIGAWLDRDGSSIKQYSPQISPQGSFLLGTIIRPIGDADEYDIDLVCTLNGEKNEFTMASLKAAVGNELIAYAEANNMKSMPEDGRRCWTLEYADEAKFHIDILPALPDAQSYKTLLESRGHTFLSDDASVTNSAIAITDKTHAQYAVHFDEWPISNPKGYAAWFASRQIAIVAARKKQLVEKLDIYDSVDDVPDYKVKTPLQRSIQLLKRHRDTMFNGDEHKPISIIISTLSAHAYQGEETVDQALRTILRNMADYIEDKNGEKWVKNPVNPEENFADKWSENKTKEENFYKWLKQAQQDFGSYSASTFDKVPEVLRERLSKATLDTALASAALSTPAIAKTESVAREEVQRVVESGEATKPWKQ